MKRVKVIFLRRKWWAAAGCLAAAILILCVVNHPAVVGASAATRQLPIYCVEKDYKVLSISFDAAWGNEDTQQLIDILGKYNIKATFFVVGEWVDKYPESVKALHDAGHEVMSHSNDPRSFQQPVCRGDYRRLEHLQRQDRGGDRGAADPVPLPLRGV